VYRLGEIAAKLELELRGDASRMIHGLASLAVAGPDQLSFLWDSNYQARLMTTRAAAVITSGEFAADCPCDLLLAEDPYLSFARATALFTTQPGVVVGVHSSAVVDPSVRIGVATAIGPGACVEPDVTLEDGVILGPGVFVGRGAHIGCGSNIGPNTCIHAGVLIGRGCQIGSNSVLGGEGFGFARAGEGWEPIRHLGGLRIGNNVHIGSCTTVDRGSLEDTLIEDGVIIDNQVQIAHNCRIGENTAIAGCTGLAGSTIIGAHCTLAGGVGTVGHLSICDGAHVTCMSMVTGSITESGSWSSGTPMMETSDWKRSAVRFRNLDELHQRLQQLEKQ
jgi:UDP-3-O-[3-hydroxymyristoyl] glucosamine N-acyltransferase